MQLKVRDTATKLIIIDRGSSFVVNFAFRKIVLPANNMVLEFFDVPRRTENFINYIYNFSELVSNSFETSLI